MAGVLNVFSDLIGAFKFLLQLLPYDPFADYISDAVSSWKEYLGYLNYFVPVKTFAGISGLWASAVVSTYIYKIGKKAIT